MSSAPRRTVLISGASIAGPALAYWLHHYGFAVTVVEKSATLRAGGYPIDIRGTAVEVVRRMGILPRLQDVHVASERITFLDPDGGTVASLRPEILVGGVEGRDLEIRRGDLSGILYDEIRDDVEFLFNDSIATLDDRADGVDITFRSGTRRTFDLVVGADGLHSHTRGLVFGPEEQYHRYLRYCYAIFSVDNALGLSHEAVIWNQPGRSATFYAVGEAERVHGFLCFTRPEPPFDAFRNPAAQRDLVASVFAADGWEVPRMLDAMRTADDLFFDIVSQIRMPRWSAGRTALLGDAAFAPSFLTGQGSSLALVGAYVLAGELAARPDDHTAAFEAYERGIRDFVEQNQALVAQGDASLAPGTPEALAARNESLRRLTTLPGAEDRKEYTALTLPDFTVQA